MRFILMSMALASAVAASAQQQSQQQPTGVLNGAQKAQITLCTINDGSIPVPQMVAACTSLLDTAPLNSEQRASLLIARGFVRASTEPAAARADLDKGLASGGANNETMATALTTRAKLRAASDTAGMRADYDAALALAPNRVDVRYDRALFATDMGQADAAYADADAGLKIAGLSPEYEGEFLRLRAQAQVARNNPAAALSDFDQALRTSPRNGSALYSRGLLHRDAGRIDLALADLDAATRLDPKSATGARTACWTRAAYAKRDFDRARVLCDTALALEPGNVLTLDSVGLVALQQKRWQDAWTAYDGVLKIDAKSASARFGRGIAELRLGRTNDGNADIAGAVSAEPAIAQTYSGYGQQP